MPYEKYELPKYPCMEDMWDRLSKENRPIVVYGMGNGADKLIRRFEKYGIEIADFFASDGFVRGHSFHGKRVKSFSEIRESYEDFVIVLSFATNREELLYMLSELNMRYDMYVPDMPVSDESEYFDKTFFNEHYSEILKARDSFSDVDSKNAFSAIINYKLTGKMHFLMSAFSETEELYELINRKTIYTAIDAGAYNGDTSKQMKRFIPTIQKIYAMEPDNKNFSKLKKYSEAENEIEVIAINAAAWSKCSGGSFSCSGNRNSSVNSTASFEHKDINVTLLSIDTVTSDKVDYIKYDVEGAEYESLVGSDRKIKECSPVLLVSLYHRSKDIFYLVNYIKERYGNYDLFLRRKKCLPAWEIDLIAVPRGEK